MSISKVKILQGKITKKFKVYTSFQLGQGYRQNKTFYSSLSVYDEVHSHRDHKTFDSAVKELTRYLNMTDQQFRYESAKEQALCKLQELDSQRADICDDIAELKITIRKIELKEIGENLTTTKTLKNS